MPNGMNPQTACPARPYRRGRVVLFGDTWGSAAESALKKILSETFPKVYGSNWLLNLKPLTFEQVKKVVRGAMYYYGLGYSIKDPKPFYRNLQTGFAKSDPSIPKEAITKVLYFISGIDPAKYPADVALLKTGKPDPNAQALQSEIKSKEDKEALAYEIQDKINRGVGAITSKALETGSLINQALPWYLKPTTLIPIALLGGLAYLWIQKKGIQALTRPLYKSNPIPREQARKAYKMFHDRNPKKVVSIPHIDTEELVHLGSGLELGYKSSKWTGKQANYLHKFGRGVKLYMTPDCKSLILKGGKMIVKDTGINN